MCSCLARGAAGRVAPRRAPSFLLLRQKKRSKEKASRMRRPFAARRAHCVARAVRESRKLALRAQTARTPAAASTAGCPERSEGTQAVGSPFLGYFLWRSKESRSPAGARPGLQRRKHKHLTPKKPSAIWPCIPRINCVSSYTIHSDNKKPGSCPVFFDSRRTRQPQIKQASVARRTRSAVARLRAHLLRRKGRTFLGGVGAAVQNGEQPHAHEADGHGEQGWRAVGEPG